MTAEQAEGRPWRGQSPQERRDARRPRLLDAALELFGTIGYAGTSLTALCAAGGVSPRHFYELYPGREQLIADLYDELVAELGARIAAAQDAVPLEAEARVVAGLRAAVGYETEEPPARPRPAARGGRRERLAGGAPARRDRLVRPADRRAVPAAGR